jgi:hypothetical protein
MTTQLTQLSKKNNRKPFNRFLVDSSTSPRRWSFGTHTHSSIKTSKPIKRLSPWIDSGIGKINTTFKAAMGTMEVERETLLRLVYDSSE